MIKTKKKSLMLFGAMLAVVMVFAFATLGLFGVANQSTVFALDEGEYTYTDENDNVLPFYVDNEDNCFITGDACENPDSYESIIFPSDFRGSSYEIYTFFSNGDEGFTNLSSIYIPNSSKITINGYSFAGCENLKSVYIGGSDVEIVNGEYEEYAFFCSRDEETGDSNHDLYYKPKDGYHIYVPSEEIANSFKQKYSAYEGYVVVDATAFEDFEAEYGYSLLGETTTPNTGIVTDIILSSVVILTSGIALLFVLTHKKKEQF